MRRFVSVGECFLELFGDSDTGYKLHYAGFAPELARLVRGQLGPEWSVDLFTALGDDLHSQRIVDELAGAGVGIDHILKVPGRTVGLSLVDEHAEDGPVETNWRGLVAARQMADDAGALHDALADAEVIHVTGSAFGILPPRGRGRLLRALDNARRGGAHFVFAPHEWPSVWTSARVMGSTINAVATIADTVFTAVPDERAVFGDDTAEAVAGRYHEWGVAEVLVREYAPSGMVLSVADGIRRFALGAEAKADMRNARYLAARAEGATPEVAATTIAADPSA